MQEVHSVPADGRVIFTHTRKGSTSVTPVEATPPKPPSICSGCAVGTCSNSSFPSGITYLGSFFHTLSIVLLGNLGSIFSGRESRVKNALWGSGGGDLQGSHVMGTQGTVVAVGVPICAADLVQDVGTGSDGLSGFGAAQVRGAVNLGRENTNAGSVSHLQPAHSHPLDFRGLYQGKIRGYLKFRLVLEINYVIVVQYFLLAAGSAGKRLFS